MPYKRDTYTLFRYEVVAPHVRNDGSESDYKFAMRDGLIDAGFTGWTEIDSWGYWLGKLEAGTTFVIYANEYYHGDGTLTETILSQAGRACMPDQEAIQIVKFPHPVELLEG